MLCKIVQYVCFSAWADGAGGERPSHQRQTKVQHTGQKLQGGTLQTSERQCMSNLMNY